MNSFRSLSPSSSIIIRFRQYFFDKIPLTKATEALRLIHAESGKGCMNMDHSRSVNGSISIDLSKMSALEKTSDTDINTDSTNKFQRPSGAVWAVSGKCITAAGMWILP